MKRLLEWYLGAPPTDPGQGTAWEFSWQAPYPAWMPAWLVLLAAIAIAGLVVWVYLRDAGSASWPARCGLIFLRASAVVLVLFFLAQLQLSINRTGLPVVVVLLDVSESMSFEDDYDEGSPRTTANEYLASVQLSESTRLNLAKSLLLKGDGRFLKQLLSRYKVRVYGFAENAIAMGDRDEYLTTEELEELLPVIAGQQAEGEITRPGPAVRKVLDDFRGAPPTAIIVLTDGITTSSDADRLTEIADAARNRLVPIFTVGIGTEEPARDLQLYGLLAEDVAFVDDPITFTAKLKAYGLEGQRVMVALKRKNSDEALSEQVVTVGRDGVTQQVELIYTPTEKGLQEFVAEVAVRDDETNPNNNVTQPQPVNVRQEPIRVLLADSVPRYEYRYLKHLLEREAFRDRDATLKLDVVLQDAALQYAEEDKAALEHFPVKREELFQYDVVIFGDMDPAYLSPAILSNLRDFVREAGGGVIFSAGPKHNPLGYIDTPLEEMLPVHLRGATAPAADAVISQGFRPLLTVEGRKSNTIFRLAQTETESVKVWNELPELYWLFEAPELKPGAVSFAEHPIRSGSGGRLPVICLQQYGAGKVLFHATDELWRWRFRRGDLYYGRYWLQAIRYLTRSRMSGKDRGAQLTTDREQYQRGETVTLQLRFLDERLIPTEKDGVTVMVERRGDVQQPVRLSRLPQAPHIFQGRMPRAVEGAYHAWVVKPAFKDSPPAEDFHVETQSRELLQRNLDRAELMETAEITRGRYFDFDEAADLPDALPPGHPVPLEAQEPIPLWNRWEFLFLFAVILTTEWLWRKRLKLV